MVSLDAFITARLDEDEAIPLACEHGSGWFAIVEAPEHDAELQHIALHDPAVVLRQVEAVRRIVDAHRAPSSPVHRAGLVVALKVLAAVWYEHPDYDPTWRP